MSALATAPIVVSWPAQPCPACDGTMPPEAVTVSDWQVCFDEFGSYYRREVSMCCPHCDHVESRIETRRM